MAYEQGGDVCKALACGSDAVMIGSAFAKQSKHRAKDITGVWLLLMPTYPEELEFGWEQPDL